MDHMRERQLAAMENAFDIHIKHAVPIRLRQVGEQFLLCNPCVIDKHIHFTNGVEHGFYLGAVRDVRAHKDVRKAGNLL